MGILNLILSSPRVITLLFGKNMLPTDSIITALREQGFIVIDNALPDDIALSLQTVAYDHLESFQPAGIGRAEDKQVVKKIRGDEISWISGDTPATQQYLDIMQDIQQNLNRACLLGLKRYEAHYAYYPPGGFYKRHVDAFRGGNNRMVTTVYYLNKNWQPSHAGELRLYGEQEQWLADIAPVHNRLLVFMSEEFPHEVLPTTEDRFSVAGWFRIDD